MILLLLKKIMQLAEAHAVDCIGVAPLAKYREELRPFCGKVIEDFPRALSIGIALQGTIVDLLGDRDCYENVLQYKTHAYTVINNRLDNFSSLAASVIQHDGYRAMPLPAAERIDSNRVCASLPHKAAAYLAGLGWIGKSCLFIHPAYGPRVRWTTVLTDAPFKENETLQPVRCGNCQQCVEACPAKALTGKNFVRSEPRSARFDVTRCEQYFRELNTPQQLSVCGLCLYACPYGKGSSNRRKS